jgi:drug/metabolite transporter (DMT)-like permease
VAALLALLSSAMWGTSDYFGGRLSRSHRVLVVLFGTQATGLLMMLVLATAGGAWSDPTGYLGWAVLASLTGAIGLGLYYRALSIGTMGVVSPIASLGVVVPLLVGVLDGDRPTPVQAGGIGLALAGVLLASGPEVRGAAGWEPVLLAGASAGFLGLFFVAVARGSETSVVMTMTTMRVVTVGLLGLVILALRVRPGVSGRELPSFAAVGCLDAGANLAFGAATTAGLLSLVSVLGSLYPVGTILLARWLDGERLRPIQQAGVALALAGAAAISAG